jgi:hypothetical protein
MRFQRIFFMAGRKKNRLGYLAQRARRRLISRVYRRLYRDNVPEISRSVLLAGTARSGTTWLAELIALQQADQDISEMMAQEKLVEDFLGKWRDVINNAESEEEKHAIVWSIHHAIPLAQLSDGGVNVIRYEDFVSDTSRCLGELLDAIGWDFDESLSSLFVQPSRTSSLPTALEGAKVANRRWEKCLSSTQVDRIMRIVDAFGLSHLYQ